jgi:hypothetical protein
MKAGSGDEGVHGAENLQLKNTNKKKRQKYE